MFKDLPTRRKYHTGISPQPSAKGQACVLEATSSSTRRYGLNHVVCEGVGVGVWNWRVRGVSAEVAGESVEPRRGCGV